MSLTRDRKNIVLECNECGDNLETGESDFEEAKSYWQAEGWTSQLGKKDWEHHCKSCSKKHDNPFTRHGRR